MKVKDLLKKYYDDIKKIYEDDIINEPIIREELKNEGENLLNEIHSQGREFWNVGWAELYNSGKRYYGDIDVGEFLSKDAELERIQKRIPQYKKEMIKLTEVLNNNERLISLKRNELNEFSKNKIILEIGTSAENNSNCETNGYIDGKISGSKSLFGGSIGGYIDGILNSNTNSHYEEYILVKYKYNLDFETEAILFDINDYLK